jgi:hypothetical protein
MSVYYSNVINNPLKIILNVGFMRCAHVVLLKLVKFTLLNKIGLFI